MSAHSPILIGDVNGNGEIDIGDAVYIASYLADVSGYIIDSVDFDKADVNRDGKIDNTDAEYISAYLAKLDGYEKLPPFVIGDVTDTGSVNIGDAVYIASSGSFFTLSQNAT